MNNLETRRWSMAVSIATTIAVASTAYAGDDQTSKHAAGPSSNNQDARVERVVQGIEPLSMGLKEPAVTLNLLQLMKLNNDPALSVAVIDDYKIAWARAFGTTGNSEKTPATTRTLFQAGSISKSVAAAGMLALVERGKLSLDEDVNARLKSWKVPDSEYTKEQKVTLRRLASHTGGLTVHGFPGYDIDAKLPTLTQILDGVPPANTPPIRVDFVPGSKSRYSGGGITIEQQLMMDVTGEAFPDLEAEIVLSKVGMTDSSYMQPLPATWRARTATGTYADGKSVHGAWHIYPEMAAAGLWTTPTDLAKFAIEIALSKQGRSNKVLSQQMTREMLSAQPSTDGDVGLGFFVPKQKPGEFEHNGADEGFQALLIMNADTGQGAVLMANSDRGILVASDMVRSIAKEYGWKFTPEGRPVARRLVLIAEVKGVDAALSSYAELKASTNPKEHPDEGILDILGDRLLGAGKSADAIKAYQENARQFPGSANVYASLGEAFAAAGDAENARSNYEKSLKIDPNNQAAKDGLNELTSKK